MSANVRVVLLTPLRMLFITILNLPPVASVRTSFYPSHLLTFRNFVALVCGSP